MAGRLTEDPNRAKTPDYTTEAFAPLRVALTTGDGTKEEAIHGNSRKTDAKTRFAPSTQQRHRAMQSATKSLRGGKCQ
ncbi:hypothetical protein M378DRAFT_167015 [Amanita muscaria Koide BX008]|uniref:Uncharacterized protein n=1 Tax=Amanita muscaria (strain Koide BX008) TaxID=946122 RepID=A0A0C2WYA0_AMAMK|nr:hypothetical protein M378DRAFT_167015 [Amanita muscaria Koide BX008]